MEYVTLNNGVEMPILGYGTYQTPPGITERCVADALRVATVPSTLPSAMEMSVKSAWLAGNIDIAAHLSRVLS